MRQVMQRLLELRRESSVIDQKISEEEDLRAAAASEELLSSPQGSLEGGGEDAADGGGGVDVAGGGEGVDVVRIEDQLGEAEAVNRRDDGEMVSTQGGGSGASETVDQSCQTEGREDGAEFGTQTVIEGGELGTQTSARGSVSEEMSDEIGCETEVSP